jgi:hypothetical protein
MLHVSAVYGATDRTRWFAWTMRQGYAATLGEEHVWNDCCWYCTELDRHSLVRRIAGFRGGTHEGCYSLRGASLDPFEQAVIIAA